MGIHFDYQRERNQNWRYIAVAMFSTSILSVYTIVFRDSYYKYLTTDQLQSILMEFLDAVEAHVSILISATFSILLNCLYMRFAILNSFLT